MKKAFYLLFFWLSVSSAQKISPYYPGKPAIVNDYNEYQTQITFVDLNHVVLKIQDFLSSKMKLSPHGKERYNLKEGIGTISYEYLTSSGKPKKINLTFTVFPIDHDFIIESCAITGDNDLVLQFYVKYWDTNINIDEITAKRTAHSRFLQDEISYYPGHLIIKNSTIRSRDEFKTEYLAKRAKEINEKKEEEPYIERIDSYKLLRMERDSIEKTKTDSLLKIQQFEYEKKNQLLKNEIATKVSEMYITVKKQRKGLKYDNSELLESDVKDKVQDYMVDKEFGIYKLKLIIKEFPTRRDIQIEKVNYSKSTSNFKIPVSLF